MVVLVRVLDTETEAVALYRTSVGKKVVMAVTGVR